MSNDPIELKQSVQADSSNVAANDRIDDHQSDPFAWMNELAVGTNRELEEGFNSTADCPLAEPLLEAVSRYPEEEAFLDPHSIGPRAFVLAALPPHDIELPVLNDTPAADLLMDDFMPPENPHRDPLLQPNWRLINELTVPAPGAYGGLLEQDRQLPLDHTISKLIYRLKEIQRIWLNHGFRLDPSSQIDLHRGVNLAVKALLSRPSAMESLGATSLEIDEAARTHRALLMLEIEEFKVRSQEQERWQQQTKEVLNASRDFWKAGGASNQVNRLIADDLFSLISLIDQHPAYQRDISCMQLRPRLENALRNAGFDTVAQIAKAPLHILENAYGVGGTTLKAVKDFFAAEGLFWLGMTGLKLREIGVHDRCVNMHARPSSVWPLSEKYFGAGARLEMRRHTNSNDRSEWVELAIATKMNGD